MQSKSPERYEKSKKDVDMEKYVTEHNVRTDFAYIVINNYCVFTPLYYCIMKCSLAGVKRHARDLFSTGYWIISSLIINVFVKCM